MSTRKSAPRLPRPAARYWKGKAPKGADGAGSDSEDEVVDVQEVEEERDVAIRDVGDDEDEEEGEEEEGGLEVRRTVGKQPRGAISVALKDVSVSREGRVIVAGKDESGRTAAEMEEEEEEEEEEEDDEESTREDEEPSEEESTSEEEEPRPQFRPVFVPKRSRTTVIEREALVQDSEEAQKRKEAEAEARKKASHDMVAESIRRELLEKEKDEETPDIDDADGLDPAGEFEAWRLRELSRIKRDKEAELEREKEREEVERRRALPEAQRLKEDLERAEQSRKEKPKGQQKFLQKYWHKGAFHQDAEILQKHDFTESTESTVDVSLLPKVMQVKNFGKRGRTKYTHLLDQDTTVGTEGFGGTVPVRAGGTPTSSSGCFLCGGPHLKKDCPQNANVPPGRPATGANETPTGSGSHQRMTRDDNGGSRRGSWRDRGNERRSSVDRDWGRDAQNREQHHDGRGDKYDRHRYDRFEDRGLGRRQHSRSQSPWRERQQDGGRTNRRRSREQSTERGRDEKRRRVDR